MKKRSDHLKMWEFCVQVYSYSCCQAYISDITELLYAKQQHNDRVNNQYNDKVNNQHIIKRKTLLAVQGDMCISISWVIGNMAEWIISILMQWLIKCTVFKKPSINQWKISLKQIIMILVVSFLLWNSQSFIFPMQCITLYQD